MSPIRIIVRKLEPGCFFRYHIGDATRNFTSGNSYVYVLIAAARRGFKMGLRPTAAATRSFTMVSFTEAVSPRNTFVGGTCAPPSAILVSKLINYLEVNLLLICHLRLFCFCFLLVVMPFGQCCNCCYFLPSALSVQQNPIFCQNTS